MTDVRCPGILVADTFLGLLKEIPCEGQLLTAETMPSHAGGCAANVAIDLSKQGIATAVVGCVGRDLSSSVIADEFSQANVGCNHLIYSADHPTSRTLSLLVEGQDRRYIHMLGVGIYQKCPDACRTLLETGAVIGVGAGQQDATRENWLWLNAALGKRL